MRALASLLFRPRAIAVVGASDNPQKIGGRPLAYLRRFGYRGDVYAVNPHRAEVQHVRTYPTMADLPEAPDLAIIATPRSEVEAAVDACAARGVGAAIIMTSGFGETGLAVHADLEQRLAARARAAGMRLVGPNTQGIAAFHTGAVASFSTLFQDITVGDGPVAVASQSGIMSAVPIGLLERAHIGVRYSLAAGNEADVTTVELAQAALEDESVRLLLLYLESIRHPNELAELGEHARGRGVPIVCVKAGRSQRGQQTARSHTAALANEDRAADAWLRHCGIWRVDDIHELVKAAPLYLKGWQPKGRRLVVISNSGASCVMAADTAADLDLTLADFSDDTAAAVAQALPPFATAANPLDLTAGLMHDSAMLGRVLDLLSPVSDRLKPVATGSPFDLVLIDLPVSGEGYDLPLLAADAAKFADVTASAVVVSTPRPATAAMIRRAGLPAFDNPTDGLKALAQLAAHADLLRRVSAADRLKPVPTEAPTGPITSTLLNEAESLAIVRDAGVPVVPFELCGDESAVRRAFAALGPRVAVKGCSRDVPHKHQLGLVTLNVDTEAAALELFHRHRAAIVAHGARFDGVLLQPMSQGRIELALGLQRDAHFGALLMIGPGGSAIEMLDEAVLLVPPVAPPDVREALSRLPTVSARLRSLDLPAAALDAFCEATVRLGMLALANLLIRALDLNPVLLGDSGAVAVDALVDLADTAFAKASADRDFA